MYLYRFRIVLNNKVQRIIIRYFQYLLFFFYFEVTDMLVANVINTNLSKSNTCAICRLVLSRALVGRNPHIYVWLGTQSVAHAPSMAYWPTSSISDKMLSPVHSKIFEIQTQAAEKEKIRTNKRYYEYLQLLI